MKVRDLIKRLSDFPGDMPVLVPGEGRHEMGVTGITEVRQGTVTFDIRTGYYDLEPGHSEKPPFDVVILR